MNILNRLIKKYQNLIYKKASPAERGKILNEGFYSDRYNVGTGCEIYVMPGAFGSEPYLVQIGNNVRITDGVRFCTHDGGMWVLRNQKNLNLENADRMGRIIVEDNVHIGWDAIIMPNVRIGHDSVVGCGAVVTKNVPPRSIVGGGVPARIIKTLDEYIDSSKDKIDLIKQLPGKEKEMYIRNKFGL